MSVCFVPIYRQTDTELSVASGKNYLIKPLLRVPFLFAIVVDVHKSVGVLDEQRP